MPTKSIIAPKPTGAPGSVSRSCVNVKSVVIGTIITSLGSFRPRMIEKMKAARTTSVINHMDIMIMTAYIRTTSPREKVTSMEIAWGFFADVEPVLSCDMKPLNETKSVILVPYAQDASVCQASHGKTSGLTHG